MQKYFEFLRFWKKKKIDKVQIAFDVFIQHFKESGYTIQMKTAGIIHDDLYVEFRGKPNIWLFKIFIEKSNPSTQFFLTNPPEEIRHVLCDLSFEEAVRLVHRLKPEPDSEVEIPEFIMSSTKHLTLSSGSLPRAS